VGRRIIAWRDGLIRQRTEQGGLPFQGQQLIKPANRGITLPPIARLGCCKPATTDTCDVGEATRKVAFRVLGPFRKDRVSSVQDLKAATPPY